MKLLVIEDEHRLSASLKKGLEQERYVVDVAYDGITGFDLASEGHYDVILLDLMIPGMDGMTLCKNLRTHHIHTPILMLTAKSMTTDKITGLDAGADDYLTKPFSFDELLARIRALTRRPEKQQSDILLYRGLTLNKKMYEVARNKTPIRLSKREFMLLSYLLRHTKQIVTKDDIIAHVWDYDADILPNTVEVYIKNLREKIDVPYPDEIPLISTIRGFGYKME